MSEKSLYQNEGQKYNLREEKLWCWTLWDRCMSVYLHNRTGDNWVRGNFNKFSTRIARGINTCSWRETEWYVQTAESYSRSICDILSQWTWTRSPSPSTKPDIKDIAELRMSIFRFKTLVKTSERLCHKAGRQSYAECCTFPLLLVAVLDNSQSQGITHK